MSSKEVTQCAAVQSLVSCSPLKPQSVDFAALKGRCASCRRTSQGETVVKGGGLARYTRLREAVVNGGGLARYTRLREAVVNGGGLARYTRLREAFVNGGGLARYTRLREAFVKGGGLARYTRLHPLCTVRRGLNSGRKSSFLMCDRASYI